MKTPLPFSALLAALLVLPAVAQGEITVTTLTDENDTPAGAQISLREALRDSATGDQIGFDASLAGKVCVLTGGELVVSGKTLTVSAPGGLTVDARAQSRHFRIAAGAGLTLTGLALQNGRAPAEGGAILNAGTLTLTDCVLRDNRAADGVNGATGTPGRAPAYIGDPNYAIPGTGGSGTAGKGGGAVSSTGSLTALRCRFTGNAAGKGGQGGEGGPGGGWQGGGGGNGGNGGNGGAIQSNASLLLTECIFESNTSGQGGDGGADGVPQFSIVGPGLGGNSGNGGAVHQTGSTTVERCSFTGNACPPGGLKGTRDGYYGGLSGSGAAFFWNTGTATLTNCTITGNRTAENSPNNNQLVRFGGAVASSGGTLLKLVHCTIAQNLSARVRQGSEYGSWPTASAAGIVSDAPVQCENCILSGNQADRSTDNSTPVWQEFNFSTASAPAFTPSAPLAGAAGENALLTVLSLAGSPLPVLLPGPGSPALNAGVVLSSPPSLDQRGLPRAEGTPDLGAVEIQPSEATPLAAQSIFFSPPARVELTTLPLTLPLTVSASSGLPVTLELLSGPATLTGSSLSLSGIGFVIVRATQAGNGATAPAASVTRVIETVGTQQTISFAASSNYAVFPGGPTTVTLPTVTSGSLPVAWSIVGAPTATITLNGNLVSATTTGTLQIKGENAGGGLYAPFSATFNLTFANGNVWWATPSANTPGPIRHYLLVEGSPHGFYLTAQIQNPHQNPVSVPMPAQAEFTATPAFIPPGQTSVQCLITAKANPQLQNGERYISTGYPTTTTVTAHIVNRLHFPLLIEAPSHVRSGVQTTRAFTTPGVSTSGGYLVLDYGPRTFTVTATDFDHPEIPVPVSGNITGGGPFLAPSALTFIFPPMNRRVRITATSDDGITGSYGPVNVYADTNTDGDGIDDIVEAALQRPANQFQPHPLTLETTAGAIRVILASRPRDLQGWTLTIEQSTNLQAWTTVPAAATTVTPNPDGITERVSVLLPAGGERYFVRLSAALPP